MSRKIQNTGLGRICETKGVRIKALSSFLQCNANTLYLYSARGHHYPLLEKKLAHFFRLSVRKLRAQLFPQQEVTTCMSQH